MVGRGLFRFHRCGGLGAWRLLRVRRRTVRAQGASSGSTVLVFVVPVTRVGAARTLARSGRSTPGYVLSGLQPEEPGTGGTRG